MLYSASDAEVRLSVFSCLSETDNPFSIHLAQAEMLELIFMGLQDESLEIREVVIGLLGRLGDINPAYVMPALRRVLIQVPVLLYTLLWHFENS